MNSGKTDTANLDLNGSSKLFSEYLKLEDKNVKVRHRFHFF